MATQVSACAEQLVHEIDKTPEEYLPNLLQIIRSGSVTLRPAEVSFRRGWEEAMAGETKPVSGLWEV